MKDIFKNSINILYPSSLFEFANPIIEIVKKVEYKRKKILPKLSPFLSSGVVFLNLRKYKLYIPLKPAFIINQIRNKIIVYFKNSIILFIKTIYY
jgi:hypothetical protein